MMPGESTIKKKTDPVSAWRAKSPKELPNCMPKFMPDICVIILAIGPIISRASSGMDSNCASAMCWATGETMHFHIGMVLSSQVCAFQASGDAEAVGSEVDQSNDKYSKA